MIPNIPVSKYLLFNPRFRMNYIPIHKKWFSIQLGRSKKLFHSVMVEEENITQQIILYECIQKLIMIWNIFHTILEFFSFLFTELLILNFKILNFTDFYVKSQWNSKFSLYFEFHWILTLVSKGSEIQNADLIEKEKNKMMWISYLITPSSN